MRWPANYTRSKYMKMPKAAWFVGTTSLETGCRIECEMGFGALAESEKAAVSPWLATHFLPVPYLPTSPYSKARAGPSKPSPSLS